VRNERLFLSTAKNQQEMISVVIPTYEMHGFGARFLDFSLDKIAGQTYRNVEVVVSDHSQDLEISDVCRSWIRKGLDLKYLRNDNDRGNSSANLNNALRHAQGEYFKILFQDDFLISQSALENIEIAFRKNKKKSWLVSACGHSVDGILVEHPFYPKYNDQIHLGNNTISSPSVLAIRNQDITFFDEQLIWLMDVDYYKRLYEKFGEPIILDELCVANRVWEKQLSNTISDSVKNAEFAYVTEKYS
jgi:glycosyltransferase involved in cell wall biosynthesis